MKTLSQIAATLKEFENKYGFLPVDQGSDEWLKIKLGVISASNASKLVAKKDSETRATYMAELVAQILTGEQEEINSKYLEHGKLYESAARASYEFSSGVALSEVPFVFNDSNFREGCSPDALIEGVKAIEIKCPYNAVHYVKFFCDDKIKKEYEWQYQFQMRVLGCEQFDFCQYHPFVKTNNLKIQPVEKSEEMQKTLADAVPQFIDDMDKMLAKFEVKFGDQWQWINN